MVASSTIVNITNTQNPTKAYSQMNDFLIKVHIWTNGSGKWLPLPTIVSDEEGRGLGALTPSTSWEATGQERGNWRKEVNSSSRKSTHSPPTSCELGTRKTIKERTGQKEEIGKRKLEAKRLGD